MARQTALLVLPGRGSYGRAELGSLANVDLSAYDAQRAANGRPTIRALDAADRFSPGVHLAGANAAPLIYAASMADVAAIDRERIEIVAVTGNSMGWYTALAAAGAVGVAEGFRIADAMGTNSGRHGAGGQLVLSTLGPDWRPVPGLRDAVMTLAERTGVLMSIDLGGNLVLAGDEAGLRAFAAETPVEATRLAGHGPFHTALMAESSAAALAELGGVPFRGPRVPLIDGRGHVWRPWASDADALHRYTFEHQILRPYDLAAAIRVGLREYAPDRVILAGPGDGLGAAIGQIMIGMEWLGMTDKAAFARRQAHDPYLVAMARPDQRAIVA